MKEITKYDQEAQKRAEVLTMEMDEQNFQHEKLKQEELQVCKQLDMFFTFSFSGSKTDMD